MHRRRDDDIDPARRTILALAATFAASEIASAAASPADGAGSAVGLPPDLAQAVNDYDRATVRNDTATLAGLIADDYVLVNSDASVQNKPQYLADFHLPGFKIDPYVMQQPVHKVWGNTALTGGLLPLSWTQEGGNHKRLLRIAHVWIRREGRWRITYTQLTRVPQ